MAVPVQIGPAARDEHRLGWPLPPSDHSELKLARRFERGTQPGHGRKVASSRGGRELVELKDNRRLRPVFRSLSGSCEHLLVQSFDSPLVVA